jgi:hypothetical protein
MPELDNLMMASVNAMAKTVKTMAATPWGKRNLVFRMSHAVNASFPWLVGGIVNPSPQRTTN